MISQSFRTQTCFFCNFCKWILTQATNVCKKIQFQGSTGLKNYTLWLTGQKMLVSVLRQVLYLGFSKNYNSALHASKSPTHDRYLFKGRIYFCFSKNYNSTLHGIRGYSRFFFFFRCNPLHLTVGPSIQVRNASEFLWQSPVK